MVPLVTSPKNAVRSDSFPAESKLLTDENQIQDKVLTVLHFWDFFGIFLILIYEMFYVAHVLRFYLLFIFFINSSITLIYQFHHLCLMTIIMFKVI